MFENWFRSLRRRNLKRKRKMLPKLHWGRERFRERYPQYETGIGTYGIPHVHDWAEGSTLRIGSYTSISAEVHIFLGGHHRTDWISCFPFPAYIEEVKGIQDFGGTRGDVNIGSDVWLAYGCTILSGVTIGHGAVVAARAVVSRDVAPYAIVAGNPARVVGWRFGQGVRDALLKSAWWTWPEPEVRRVAELLCSDRLVEFLAYVEKRSP
jgi:acetyltransferase-like isoleucine patch superfamily enzyme